MNKIKHLNKEYQIDDYGFLANPEDWDEGFATTIAKEFCSVDEISERHWQIIYYIRNSYKELKTCPLIFMVCKQNNVHLQEFKKLFPTGYQRGACKIAGLNYKTATFNYWVQNNDKIISKVIDGKQYIVDTQGFLENYSEWDMNFAIQTSKELKYPNLTDKHFEIINFIRSYYLSNSNIPTIIETCERFNLDIQELEELFPSGYHRGAVKLAGLKLF